MLGIVPLLVGISDLLRGRLGANPVEEITHRSGSWALRCLVLCLAVTPVRRLLGWPWLTPYRRTLGLLAFGYAALHFCTYLALDLGWRGSELMEDVLERPYITLGFGTFLILATLAVTSTRRWQRRLGARWAQLHELVYAAAIGAVVHFYWGVKADPQEPMIYLAIVVTLLGTRIARRLLRSHQEYARLRRSP